MSPLSPSPGQVLGHFRLIEQIGQGGMGIVYRARDERLEREVAVKVLNAKTLADVSSQRRFRREALILSRLNHPNVEAVYDFHSEEGIDYLVLEYVPGISLDERLLQGALPVKEVIALAVQLACGLAAAHAQNIIHRDLKPGNLRVTPEKVLKILDFGLAQLSVLPEEGALADTETVQHRFAGTPPYSSPEQLLGKEPDVRSDIYSAGVVLYELATGFRPFPQQQGLLFEAILKKTPPAPRTLNREIPPALEAVILKCLEKEPANRYQSSTELLGDLQQIAGQQVTTDSTRRSTAVPRVSVRQRWAFLIAAFALLALLVWRPLGPKETQQRIMAVLPFEAVGQDAATSALGLGLTETVAAKLVEASESSLVQFVSPHELLDKKVTSAADARREFGTDLVLEGTLQQSGQKLRITCTLVDSRTSRQITARTFTRNTDDIFALQDDVVAQALDMLPVRLHPQLRPELAKLPDTQPPAYEAYVRGRGYLQEYQKPENIDSAITEFHQAVKIDPNYAPAYAGLGEAYWIGFQQPMNRGKAWLNQASQNCEKSLALNPHLAEARKCLGNVSFGTGKYEDAVEQYQRALDLNPNNDEALEGLASAYEKLRQPSRAEEAFKKAIALRPNYWGGYSWLGEFYANQARYSEAANMFQKAIDVAPDNYRGYSNLSAVYVYEGRYPEAIQTSQRSIDLRPNRDAYANLGAAYFLQHRYAEAAETFKLGLQFDDQDPLNWGNLGDALYWTPGRRTEARDAYQKAISLARSQSELNPRDANAIAYIAEYSAMLDDRKTATTSSHTALDLAPDDPIVMFRAALVCNHFGDKSGTLSWLDKAAKAGLSRPNIRDTPDFDHLKTDPDFLKLTTQ
jgi:serine/threonine-protein kinase